MSDRRHFLYSSFSLLAASATAGAAPTASVFEGEATLPMPTASQIINLWPDGSPNNPGEDKLRPRLEVFQPDGKSEGPRAVLIVCPGGAYARLAPHEGAPVAQLAARQGMVGMVLTYRHAPHLFPAPYLDACRAIRLVRSQARELNINPDKIALMGFSAGGHLASTVATQPNLHPELDDLSAQFSARPNGSVLAYPVITMGQYAHKGSMTNLLGPNPTAEQLIRLSGEKQVTAETPPTFLFHTAEDPGVPVENSLQYALALRANKVPVDLHIYAKGRHGVGLASDVPHLAGWPRLLEDWLLRWRS